MPTRQRKKLTRKETKALEEIKECTFIDSLSRRYSGEWFTSDGVPFPDFLTPFLETAYRKGQQQVQNQITDALNIGRG